MTTQTQPADARLRMLFVLIGTEGRNGPVDGDSIRTGGVGASGTDQSTIMVAEHLAARGHRVTIATCKTDPGAVVRGVRYTDLEFGGVPGDERTFDVLFTMLWFSAFDALPVVVTRALVIVQHMQYVYSGLEARDYAQRHGLTLGALHVSEWEERRTRAHLDGLGAAVQAVIPNPVMTDLADAALAEGRPRAPREIAFFAAWNRGAELARDAFLDHLGWRDGGLVCSDYTRCTLSRHEDARIRELGSNDKTSLFRTLTGARYFLYGCVNRGGGMHYDTFGCVVAEALALGLTVLCYPLGALPETFRDCVEFMPFPPGVDAAAMERGDVHVEERLFDPEGVARHLQRLEASPERREQLREAGMRRVRERFGIATVGPMWERFLDRLLSVAPR